MSMKKNHITALALAASFCMSAFATETQATAPVQDPTLASSQQTVSNQTVQDPSLAETETPAESTVPARKATGVFMDVNIGTMGIGMNIGYEFNRYLKLRVRGSYLAADYDKTWNEDSWGVGQPLNGKFEFDGSSVGLLLDYHPFAGCFHLTGGLNFSGMKLDAKATMEGSDTLSAYNGVYEFGGYEYRVEGLGKEAQVKGRYEWNRVQPYLGFGWSSNGEGKRSVYFSCDIGVNFIGKGSLKVSHSGADIHAFDRNTGKEIHQDIDSLLEQSLREEGKDFFDIADKLIVYPVIQFGIGGRF